MAMLTVPNVPDEVRRALQVRHPPRQQHGSRSAQHPAVRSPQSAVSAQGQLKLGSLLADVGRQARLTDRMAVATRAGGPFAAAGATVINPWAAAFDR